MKAFAIARLTFLEAWRRKLLWVVVLMGLAFCCLFGIGFYFVHRDLGRGGRSADPEVINVLLIIGLYVVNILTVILAVLTSADTIAGEIASGTIHTIVTKPLRRWEIVLGKWLGLGTMLTAFVVLMGAGLMAIVWFIGHYLPPNPLQGMAMMVVEGMVVLTLSILGGTRLPTLTNGVVVFMLYGLAFIAGWIEQIGAFTHNATAVNIGIVVSLLMPSETMWKRAAYLMQPPFLRQLGMSPFGTASAPSPAMVAYAIVYIAAALLAALRLFQARDL